MTPWTVALQASLSMGFLRQEYWSVLPFPSPENLPDPGMKPTSPALSGRFFTSEPPGEPSESVEFAFLILARHCCSCCAEGHPLTNTALQFSLNLNLPLNPSESTYSGNNYCHIVVHRFSFWLNSLQNIIKPATKAKFQSHSVFCNSG